MARRSRDWNESLAKELKNREFAREFILAAVEEGLAPQIALAKFVRVYGVEEYARRVKMAPSNLVRNLRPGANLTTKTLERLLKPLDIALTLKRRSGAA